MKKITNRILELLYPPKCPLCGEKLLGQDEDICTDCGEQVERIGEHFCLKCGKRLEETGREFCRDCENIPIFLYRTWGSFLIMES